MAIDLDLMGLTIWFNFALSDHYKKWGRKFDNLEDLIDGKHTKICLGCEDRFVDQRNGLWFGPDGVVGWDSEGTNFCNNCLLSGVEQRVSMAAYIAVITI